MIEPLPTRMPARRPVHSVRPIVPTFESHETEILEAIAYRRLIIEERGVIPSAAEVILRSTIWLRDGGRCRYCGRLIELRRTGDVPPRDRMTFDHVIPVAQGGHHTHENVWASCYDCNTMKGGMTLPEFDEWLLNEIA